MDIYQFPLNKAHFYSRKAENCLEKQDFSLAVDYHQKASESLEAIHLETNNSYLKESIQLQITYHINQIKSLTFKMSQRLNENSNNEAESFYTSDSSSLTQQAIQCMIKTDSLLKNFQKANDVEDKMKASSKKEKNQKEIIEELIIYNECLRKHLVILVNELEETKQERDETLHRLQMATLENSRLEDEIDRLNKNKEQMKDNR